jgi:hypothetical protein
VVGRQGVSVVMGAAAFQLIGFRMVNEPREQNALVDTYL